MALHRRCHRHLACAWNVLFQVGILPFPLLDTQHAGKAGSMFTAQRVVLAVSCIFLIGYLKHLWDNTHDSAPLTSRAKFQRHVAPKSGAQAVIAPPQHHAPGHIAKSRCKSLRALGLDHVAIVLKTGSTEIYEKLPIHLSTTFECLKDQLIYSDVPQTFANVPVRDALALISPTLRNEHEELKQYHTLKEQVRLGGDAAHMKGDKSWKLDKLKFLPMISDACRVYEDQKTWYIFVEADTYLSLQNLLLWLQRLDYNKPIYAGAQVLIGETEFGHGGSGFLLSAPAARALSNEYMAKQEHWDTLAAADCCGDKVMAEALRAATPSIHLLRAFPLIQGETITSLDWSATHWCKPAVTWHHVSNADMDRHYQFELDWHAKHGAKKPVLFRDYYAAFVDPLVSTGNNTLGAWDNLSGDWAFDAQIAGAPMGESQYDIAVETPWYETGD